MMQSTTSFSIGDAQVIQSRIDQKERAPWRTRDEWEKNLKLVLGQIQENKVDRLDLSFTKIGQFYNADNPWSVESEHKSPIQCLASLSNGYLASGSDGIEIWNVEGRKRIPASGATGHEGVVYSLATPFSNNGNPNVTFASGSEDTTVKIWRADNGNCNCRSTLGGKGGGGHSEAVRSVVFLSDKRLASGSEDTAIKIWDITEGRCISTLKEHTETVYSVEPLNGFPETIFASGSRDKTVNIWDIRSPVPSVKLVGPNGNSGHSSAVYCLKSLSDRFLASGSYDKKIKIWDIRALQGDCLHTWKAHTKAVEALGLLSPEILVSGSKDGTVKIWEINSGKCLYTAQMGEEYEPALAIAVLPDKTLAISIRNVIRFWKPEPASLSAKQMVPILEALKTNTAISHLDLSGNPHISDDVIDPLIDIFTPKQTELSFYKPNSSLETINLNRTVVTQRKQEELSRRMKQIAQRRKSIKESLSYFSRLAKMSLASPYYILKYLYEAQMTKLKERALDLQKSLGRKIDKLYDIEQRKAPRLGILRSQKRLLQEYLKKREPQAKVENEYQNELKEVKDDFEKNLGARLGGRTDGIWTYNESSREIIRLTGEKLEAYREGLRKNCAEEIHRYRKLFPDDMSDCSLNSLYERLCAENECAEKEAEDLVCKRASLIMAQSSLDAEIKESDKTAEQIASAQKNIHLYQNISQDFYEGIFNRYCSELEASGTLTSFMSMGHAAEFLSDEKCQDLAMAPFLSKEKYILIKLIFEKHQLKMGSSIKAVIGCGSSSEMEQIIARCEAIRSAVSSTITDDLVLMIITSYLIDIEAFETVKTTQPSSRSEMEMVSIYSAANHSSRFLSSLHATQANLASSASTSSAGSSYSSSFHATSGNAVSVSSDVMTSSELYQGIFHRCYAEVEARGEDSSSTAISQKAKALADAECQKLTQS